MRLEDEENAENRDRKAPFNVLGFNPDDYRIDNESSARASVPAGSAVRDTDQSGTEGFGPQLCGHGKASHGHTSSFGVQKKQKRIKENAMQIKEIMSKDIEYVEPDASIDEVAQKMRDNDSGAILVGSEDKMVGMITDHDLATKVIADSLEPRTVKANDVMNAPVLYCFEDQDVEEVADNMIQQHALCMLVVDRHKHAKGVVAHSDFADAIVKNGLYMEPLAEKIIKLASKVAA